MVYPGPAHPVELDPAVTLKNIEEAEQFPAYATAGEKNEQPVQNSLLLLAGAEAFFTDNTIVSAFKLGGGLYLRDRFSIGGSLVFPLAKRELNNGSQVTLPIQMKAGGRFHALTFSVFDLYLPALAGIELNHNNSDRYGAQAFVELGAGMQFYIDALYLLRLEAARHLSNIPQNNGRYRDNNYWRLEVSAGFFF